MNKSIVAVSSVLQLIAAIMFIVVIRTAIMWQKGQATGGAVTLVVFITIATQVLSVKLRDKFSAEVKVAENIMQKPKTGYGWIPLGVFGVTVLFVVICAMYL